MKTKKIGSYAFIAIAIVGVLLFAGCPSTTENEGGGTVQFSGVLYEDGFTSGVTDPQYWNVDESKTTDEERARGFVTGPDTTVFKNGTESFKVDWSQATDWMGLALHVGSGTTISGTVDLSGYTALTFWAKADGSDAEIDEFGFGADDDKMFTNGEKYKTSIKNITVPSADWKKFIIPLPNPAKLTAVNSLFYAVDNANGGTIYLDDIKFEKLSNVAIKTFDYTGNILDVVTAGTANIGDLSAVFTDGTDDITVSFENLAAHVSWASDKPAVATVDNDGKITGVATGSAIITGTLGGKTVTINVTVGQAVTFTGVLFDDALQGGFSINKDAHNGADKITIDSAASVDSRTAIQVSLASDAGDWGGFFFERSSGVDISGKTLQFSIYKSSLDTAPITKLVVKLQDTKGAGSASDHFFEIDLFAPNFTKTENGNWYEFSIPVAAFNNNAFDAADFNVLGFWNPKKDDGSGNDVPATGDFVFDDIQFVTTTATTYTVTYDANNADGGTLSKATDTVNDGQTVSAAPTGITRTGYTLSGWNTQSDGNGDAFVFGTTAVTADITLFAQWTAVYTVTYDANNTDGGTLSKPSDTVTPGGTIAEAPTGTRAGHTLIGWNTAADGTGTDFIFGTTPVTADITLFAQWVPFTGVLFDDALQGGFVANKNVGPGAGAESPAEIDDTVYAGTSGSSIKFDLTGSTEWGGGYVQNVTGVDASAYTSLSFSVNLSQLGANVDYMQLKLEDVDGDDDPVDLYSLTPTSTTGDWKTYTLYLANSTNVNYSKFKAIGFWHPRAGGASGTYTPGTYYVDEIKFGNDTLSTTHTVTYNANGNTGGNLDTTTETVTFGNSIPTPPTGAISKTGFTFSGWNTQADGKGTNFVFGTTQVTTDIILYAKWMKDFTGAVYNDAVEGGFEIKKDSSQGAEQVVIIDPLTVDSQTALQVNLAAAIESNGHGGFFFERSAGVDVSGKTLKFSIYKTSLDQAPATTALGVKLQDSQGAWPAKNHFFEIDLLDTKFTKTSNGNWYDFSIPVSDFASNDFDATDLTVIGFWNPKKDDGSSNNVMKTGIMVIIDNIRFE